MFNFPKNVLNISSYISGISHFKTALNVANFNAPSDRNCGHLIRLGEEIPGLYNRVDGLRKDIFIDNKKNQLTFSSAVALGSHSGLGSPLIEVNQNLKNSDISHSARHFILMHEVGHIYHNHLFLRHCVIGAARLALLGSCYAAYHLGQSFLGDHSHRIPLGIGMIGINYFANNLFKKLESYLNVKQEHEADDFAIEHATNQELIGGRCYFLGMILAEVEINNLFREVNNGQSLERPHSHPESSIRSLAIEKEIMKRNIDASPLNTDPKNIEQILAFRDFFLLLNLKAVQQGLEPASNN